MELKQPINLQASVTELKGEPQCGVGGDGFAVESGWFESPGLKGSEDFCFEERVAT